MSKHKSYDPALKAKVVIEALQGGKTMAQVCREYNLAEDLVCRWRQQFLEPAPQLFAEPKRSAEEQQIAELERLMGQLTVELSATKNYYSEPMEERVRPVPVELEKVGIEFTRDELARMLRFLSRLSQGQAQDVFDTILGEED